jgi:hypothetical protein
MNGGGTTTIASGATLTIDGGGTKTLDNYTLNNAGTTSWSGTGGLTLTNSATFNNTGTFNAETDQNIGGSPGTFSNSGTFTKTSPSGTGTTRIDATFNNTGTVTVTTGVLQLNGGGTNSSAFSVASGQTLQFTSNAYTLGTGATLGGSGVYDINSGGTLVNDISVTVVNVTLENGGTLSGPGTVTVSSAFDWSNGGTMNAAGTTTIKSGATLTLTGGNTFVLDDYKLNNAGTTTWTGTGDLDDNNGSVFSNTGTFNVQTDANLVGGSATFANAGTFTKTSPSGTGTTRIDPTFNNTGTVTVTTGVLQLNGGGSNSSTFSVASGQTLQFTSGNTYTLSTGATLMGSGLYDINGGFVVNDISLTVVDVTLENGGTLSGPGTLTVSSAFNWTSGGTMNAGGTTIIPAGATLTLGGGSSTDVLDNYTLNNAGTTNWTSTGALDITDSALFSNTGTFNDETDADITGGSATFANAGTLTKTSPSGTGTTRIDPTFNNTGTVTVTTGVLRVNGGGANSKTFSVASGQTLQFTGGTAYDLNSGTLLKGSGTYDINGGDVVNNTTVTPVNVTLENGSTLSGPGTLTVSGAFVWSGGSTMNADGTTTIKSGATLTLTGGNTFVLDDYTLNNAGTTTWTGTGDLEIMDSALFSNTHIFNLQTDANIIGNATFSNAGTVTKTSPSGTGTTEIDPTFNNSGTVTVSSGVLNLAGGGTSSSTFTEASGHLLEFIGGSYTVNTGTTFTGAGTPTVAGGTVDVNGAVTAARFEVDSGTLNGSGNLTTTSTFTWTGGTLANANGQLTLAAGSTLNISGNLDKTLDGRTLDLSGNTTWKNNGNISVVNGGTITNEATGVFTIANNQGLTGTGTFDNLGLLQKTGGTATSTIGIELNNSGTVAVTTGTLKVTGTVDQIDGTTLTGGTWSVTAGGTALVTLKFNTPAKITALGSAAGVTLNGANAAFTNLSGLTSNAGSFSLLGGQTFTTAGNFTNTGSLTLGPASTLAMTGSFTQTSAGTLTIEIGGTNASPTIGSLTTAATGTVKLGGTLTVTSTVTPAVGSTAFTVVNNQGSSAISGIFAGLPEGATFTVNGMTFQITYKGGTGNDVVLTRTA